MKIGVVGNGRDKFTELGMAGAILLIGDIVRPGDVVVSGHSPMGGIDIWAEDYADLIRTPKMIFAPVVQKWEGGYKERNLDIARESEELHVIVADVYPPDYSGRKLDACYHCGPLLNPPHVNSGACWTAKRFEEMHGKKAIWHIVSNGG